MLKEHQYEYTDFTMLVNRSDSKGEEKWSF